MLHIKFVFDWTRGFRDVMYHVYYLGLEANEPLGSNIFQNHNIQSYCPFPARFSFKIQFSIFKCISDLCQNTSWSSQAHVLYIHCSTLVINASCQVSLKLVHRFWRRFLKGFYMIIIWTRHPSRPWDLDYL